MSIRQVARTCNVSPMTVSLVLNNPDTGRVSPETRARVLKAVRDLGYQPKPRAASRDAIKTIGIVAPVNADLFGGDDYVGKVLQGFVRQPGSRRCNLMLFANELFRSTDVHDAVRAYCDGKCDGLAMIAPNRKNPLVRALVLRGLPLVVIGTNEQDDPTAEGPFPPVVVDVDNRAIGRQATFHLSGLGHRRIGFVGGPEFVVSTHQRCQGYRDAMAAHGLPVDPRWVSGAIPRQWEVQDAVNALLALPRDERPTALVCWNDGSAVEALATLREKGVRVPEEMSLTGVDDSPHSDHQAPALTTFRQPWDQIGEHALAALQQQFDAETRDDDQPTEYHLLPAEFILRASTAPPPA